MHWEVDSYICIKKIKDFFMVGFQESGGEKNTRGIKKPKGYLFVPFQLLLFIYLSSY